MSGGPGTTNVAAGLRLPPNKNPSSASAGSRRAERKTTDSDKDGALATARAAVSQSLGESGFVDITAPLSGIPSLSSNVSPAQEEMGDLSPGALKNLIGAIKAQLAANAEQSARSQANIRPDAAVTLLT